jgi:branched-chain amino acid transport system ATP-binding protein
MSLLTVSGVGKTFSGLEALSDVSFEVVEGEIVGLIGPNGAGKTTLFNCIAGRLPPTTGTIWFRDRDVTGGPAHAIANLGIARTFQLMRPFASMSVRDNVTVAALSKGYAMAEARERAGALVERVRLSRYAGEVSGALPTAARKRLELAKALALEPELLLLDEVLAGLMPGERDPILDLLLEIRDEGVTLLFVEHVMAAVMRLSDRVLVLHHGKLLAAGTPREVVSEPAVVEAYLGEEMFLADS